MRSVPIDGVSTWSDRKVVPIGNFLSPERQLTSRVNETFPLATPPDCLGAPFGVLGREARGERPDNSDIHEEVWLGSLAEMNHQEVARSVEIACVRCRSHLGEAGEVGAERSKHVAFRREPDLDLTPATKGPSKPIPTRPRGLSQLAR